MQLLLTLLGVLTGMAVLFVLYGFPFLYCARAGLQRNRPGLTWFALLGWIGVLICLLMPTPPPEAQGGAPRRR